MKALPNRLLTESDAMERSARHLESARFRIAHAMAYLIDQDKGKRLEQRRCAYCFYFDSMRLAGQAFTEWTCGICRKEARHPNTDVPEVCLPCAKKHSICVDCGADLHLRQRRKPSLPEREYGPDGRVL